MSGFLGDIAKPALMATGIGAIPAVNKALRPPTSSEKTKEKHKILAEEERIKKETAQAEADRIKQERLYFSPESIRQRTEGARSELAKKSGKRASQFLAGGDDLGANA